MSLRVDEPYPVVLVLELLVVFFAKKKTKKIPRLAAGVSLVDGVDGDDDQVGILRCDPVEHVAFAGPRSGELVAGPVERFNGHHVRAVGHDVFPQALIDITLNLGM